MVTSSFVLFSALLFFFRVLDLSIRGKKREAEVGERFCAAAEGFGKCV